MPGAARVHSCATVMKNTNSLPGSLAASALAFLLVALASATAFAAPLDASSSIRVAQGEQSARSCYLRAEELWNRVIASASHDHRQLDVSYRAFAGCAKIAIFTGRLTRAGQRLPWLPEYFADTVGATYAQLQLAIVTGNPEHCTHLKQARDLAEQALETEGEMDTPGDAHFESIWQALQQNVKLQTAGCSSAPHVSQRASSRPRAR